MSEHEKKVIGQINSGIQLKAVETLWNPIDFLHPMI